ncbi:MAG: hypothetical protein QM765_00920 [Myxococcales bacterium]
MRVLVTARRFDQAIAAADQFRLRYPGDARLPEVQVVRARLLCALPGRSAAAVETFQEVVAMEAASAQVRQEALFAMAACQNASGDRAGAEASWRLYLERFPDGAHAEEARRAWQP